jgi:hypothetical protein
VGDTGTTAIQRHELTDRPRVRSDPGAAGAARRRRQPRRVAALVAPQPRETTWPCMQPRIEARAV